MGVLIYERTALQFANLSAQKLLVGSVCDEQPPERLREAVSHNGELKIAFGFQEGESAERGTMSEMCHEISTAATFAGATGPENHVVCTLNDKSLCISTVSMGLTGAHLCDKVCIVQDQSVYNELQKEKLAKQYMKDFFAMVTHELRNPLQGVLGLFEGMLEELKADDVKQQCKMGVSTVKLMMRLINDILDLSQLECNSFRLVEESADVRQLVKECVDLMQFKYKMKGVVLRQNEPVELPKVFRFDKNRYMQILLNLLGNALKFTERDGEVWVSVRYDVQAQKLFTSVKDSGIGIHDKDKEKLFTLFGKLADSAQMNPQGCGLGLHICKKLAEAMGGKISFESEYGKGTTIVYSVQNKGVETATSDDQLQIPNEDVDLSFAHLCCSAHTEMKGPSQGLPAESLALVVDDELLCANAVKSHLKHCGLSVDSVTNLVS